MPLAVGTTAPAFTLVSHDREKVSLEDLRGKKTMIVFMPYPHTRVCEGEACEIRDNWDSFQSIGANVVMITTHAGATNRDWAVDNDFNFPILSDYWPHGEVSRAYDTFDETFGYAKRTSYILDAEGVIKDVIASDVLGEARQFADYLPALQSIG